MAGNGAEHSGQVIATAWMAADVLTVLAMAVAATAYRLHTHPALRGHSALTALGRDQTIGIVLALLSVFTLVLILASRRLHLYEPLRITSFLREQRLSLQACLTAGLMLICAIFLIRANEIPRSMVLMTVGLVALGLSARRLIYRAVLYRRFEEGLGTRNVLIVGTGPEALALKNHLDSLRYLGYTFKGFVTVSEQGEPTGPEVVGTLDSLFESVRKHFVDEILITTRCEPETLHRLLEQAREKSVDVRAVPDLYDGMAWHSSPVEYIGQFPIIPLHYGRVPELGLFLKRTFDVAFSLCVLIGLLPLFVLIALVIKLESPGPVFYLSERIGKKARVFRCTKFRTMVADAEKRKADLMHMNERDGVLFKLSNDPRVTRVGAFLRKYSLDELPQFWNVLRGEMSVVGPRPPLGSEVNEYKLNHLRRLDVKPGITGLWQVEGRRDPSFASYVSLDVTYIENWSIWLDFKIILRTIGVVVAGTGT